MATPITEDFEHLAKALKKLEGDKAPATPTPPPKELDYDWAYEGSGYVAPDYDPA
jgi:hypothetical protein